VIGWSARSLKQFLVVENLTDSSPHLSNFVVAPEALDLTDNVDCTSYPLDVDG
jgi:hypothetical protein